ncbi:hypothetical protein Acr_14g0006930 [Actinidia rufa]|uniref:Uncharacterized protein n=1 Tax=Actinidia rufa TaxID=165716 RepID=A0A7J0FSZ7_9ERIC|nr:hypothetical protein Acr_14g0006930 [Actinidia rufa]
MRLPELQPSPPPAVSDHCSLCHPRRGHGDIGTTPPCSGGTTYSLDQEEQLTPAAVVEQLHNLRKHSGYASNLVAHDGDPPYHVEESRSPPPSHGRKTPLSRMAQRSKILPTKFTIDGGQIPLTSEGATPFDSLQTTSLLVSLQVQWETSPALTLSSPWTRRDIATCLNPRQAGEKLPLPLATYMDLHPPYSMEVASSPFSEGSVVSKFISFGGNKGNAEEYITRLVDTLGVRSGDRNLTLRKFSKSSRTKHSLGMPTSCPGSIVSREDLVKVFHSKVLPRVRLCEPLLVSLHTHLVINHPHRGCSANAQLSKVLLHIHKSPRGRAPQIQGFAKLGSRNGWLHGIGLRTLKAPQRRGPGMQGLARGRAHAIWSASSGRL